MKLSIPTLVDSPLQHDLITTHMSQLIPVTSLISVPVSDHHHMCPHTLLCITKQKVDGQLLIFVGQFQTLR